MKKAILIFSIILTSLIEGIGQNCELVLKNKKSGKEEIIQEGKMLRVTCRYGLLFKGRFEITDIISPESKGAILIDSNIVYLDDIEVIKVKFKDQNLLGGIFTGVGGCLTIGGISALEQEDTPDPYGCNSLINIAGTAIIVLAVAVSIAGVAILAGGKQYKSKDWEISIRLK